MLSEDIKTKVWGITELEYLRRWIFARVKGFSWGYPRIGIGIGKGGGGRLFILVELVIDIS